MNLWSILDAFAVKDEEADGWEVAQEVYEECGCPLGTVQLAFVLDRAITECVRRKVWYPKVILRRLKELQGGTWVPQAQPRKTDEIQMRKKHA